MSVVTAVAATLRDQILDGTLPAGQRLREVELCASHGAARHSVRAALRTLADEGLVTVEPNRGARVATHDAASVVALFQLRCALEVEAADLALRRHDGSLPIAVHEAVDRLTAVCARRRPRWNDASAAHGAVHTAIVTAAASPRIEAAHSRLEAETRFFLLGVRQHYTYGSLAAEHEQLVADLQADGPEVLREHLRAAAAMLATELSRPAAGA